MLNWLRTLPWTNIGTIGAFLVALAAFIRPDIEPFLRGPKVTVALPKEFVFNHRMGVLWMAPWVDIRNEGGRAADIGEVSILFKNSDGDFIKITGDSYLTRTSGDPTYFPWTSLSLKPNASWLDRINFREALPAKDEEVFRQLISELGRFWDESILPMAHTSQPKREDLKRKTELRAKIQTFFDTHFHLQRGTYKVLVVLRDRQNLVLAREAYELTLFDGAIADIKERLDEYVERPTTFFDGSLLTSVPLTPVKDQKSVDELLMQARAKGLL